MLILPSLACSAFASEQASPHQFTGSASLVSDYTFRGVSQTWHRPALQGSLEYQHTSGVFATLWASTVSEKVIAGTHAEIDTTLGYRNTLNDHASYGASVIAIYFPGGNWNQMRWGDRPDQAYDTSEINVFAGYKWVSAKYSRTLTDLLGFNEKTGFSGKTKGAVYLEINADVPLAQTGFVLALHAGRQNFNSSPIGISPVAKDYAISIKKTFDRRWAGSVQVARNTNTALFGTTRSNLDEKDIRDLGKARLSMSLSRLY